MIVLCPAWYTFMAASVYMTATVAVNRCLELKMVRGNMPHCLRLFLNSGLAQSFSVLLWAIIFILPRWFEYEIVGTGVNFTWLRKNANYNLYYWGIMNPVCFLVIPLTIMVVSTILMLRQLRAVTASLNHISVIRRNQEKRNKSISIMLIGIIILFVICHLGKLIFSCYQLWGGLAVYDEDWVKNLIIVNDTLAVTNSSLNFAIYCKDLLFRKCAKKVYNNFLKCQRSPTEWYVSSSEMTTLPQGRYEEDRQG